MFARGESPAKIRSSIALELALERVEHREVAVDHRVHQRVEHVARAGRSSSGSRSPRARTSVKPRSLRLRTEST